MSTIALPSFRFQAYDLRLRRYGTANTLYGGLQQVREIADPRWELSISTPPLKVADFRKWQAFWAQLRDGINDFLCHDVERPYPADYPNGFAGLVRAGTATAFDGTATVTALAANTIQLSGVPANFQVRVGDWIGLVEGTRYALHLITADQIALNTGIFGATRQISVSPAIRTNVFTTAAVANFALPKAKFIPIAGTFSGARSPNPAPVSFTAIQVL